MISNIEKTVKTLVADLDENIINIDRYSDVLDWVNVDIQFINPVTGSISEVSIVAHDDDSFFYCPNVKDDKYNGVVVGGINDLYNIILNNEVIKQ